MGKGGIKKVNWTFIYSLCVIVIFDPDFDLIIYLLKAKTWGIIIWPIQGDRMNMTETWQWRTLSFEFDQIYDNDKHYFLNMTEIETDKPYETDKP